MGRLSRTACALIAGANMLCVGGATPAAKNEREIAIKRVKGVRLDPVLYFPPGSHIRGVELLADKKSWHVSYIAISPVGWDETYRFYRRTYAGAKVKWYGKLPSDANDKYVFAVMDRTAPKDVKFVVIIYRRFPSAWNSLPDLRPHERSSPIILAQVEVPDTGDVIRQGHDSLLVPIPKQ